MTTVYYIILLVSTFIFSFVAVGFSYWLLSRASMLDTPEERSNHQSPVVTGGGIAVVLIAIAFFVVANSPGALIWPMFLLLGISFLDDRRSLPVKQRLAAQLVAVIIGLGAIKGPIFQGFIPMWLEYPLIVGAWLWFINLYNFMDGIDEMCIGETASLCLGLVALGLFLGEMPRFISIDAVVMLAAIVAFYPWNKHPARMFLGDAGSIPIGFVMGYLLLNLAAHGEWAAALILPSYYLADATLTLFKRALRRQPLWQAHSEHYYQQAVRSGRSHDRVVREVLVLNGVLAVLACVSSINLICALVSLALAAMAVTAVLVRFSRAPKAGVHEVAA